jgi:uncharacterized cupin superfamily protein
MVKIFNENSISYVSRNMPLPEFSWHTGDKLKEFLGAKKVSMDVRSLDPGSYSFPYHFHYNAEEIFVILSGEMTLRSPEGLTILKQGDVAFFETGAGGAHQAHNHTDVPCRYLDIMTVSDMDVCEYPDTGKVLIMSTRNLFHKGPAMGYLEGEESIASIWAGLKPAE